MTAIDPIGTISPTGAYPQILRRADVCSRIGLGRSALYDAIRNGRFPPPIKLGPRAVGWIESEVTSWITARVAEREEARR